jgi:hypothetical protein
MAPNILRQMEERAGGPDDHLEADRMRCFKVPQWTAGLIDNDGFETGSKLGVRALLK